MSALTRERAARAQHDRAFGRRLSAVPLYRHGLEKWWRWLRGKPLYRPGDGRVLAAEPERRKETLMTEWEQDEYQLVIADIQKGIRTLQRQFTELLEDIDRALHLLREGVHD